ncbi:sensor histidine kinase [Nocardiopsis mangrovi]|uniref:histidine kinase n=1 Tax=Nocardiopsis mangrovi TaxID=1179818 RepID=A0ABV9DP52_9ACTN
MQPSAGQNGEHPLTHMMRAEGTGTAPPPERGRWQRFTERLGLGRRPRPSSGQMTAQELFNAQQRLYAQQLAQQQQFANQQQAAGQPYPQALYGHPQQPQQPVAYAPQQHPGQYPYPQQHPQQQAWGQPQAQVPAPEQAAPPAPATGTGPQSAGRAQDPAAEQPAPAAKSEIQQQELVTGTLAGLALRDLALVDSLIEVVEELEDSSEDPELLEKLFKIDNLATRMRRNGENLLVLADQDSGDTSTDPVPLLDVARAAISEISEYQRVQLGRLPELFVSGTAADDISHLLAELMDNATEKSPEHAQVVVSAQRMGGDKLLVTVEDEGIGIPAAQLESLNARLRGEPVLDEQVIRHMGLYVVSRIAHRHGVQVQLEARAFRGVSAHVVLPADLFGTTGPRPAAPPSEPRPAPRHVPAGQSPDHTARPAQPAPVSHKQEKSSAMDSSVTAAGLPRRSAHKNTVPAPMAPPQEAAPAADPAEPAAEAETPAGGEGEGTSRAERIRADLEGFLEGQREAADE